MDPLICVRKIQGSLNREVGALIASVISYGRVEIIIKNCESLFSVMEWRPADFVLSTSGKMVRKLFTGFKHRFTDSNDIVTLIDVLRVILDEFGSVEHFFCTGIAVQEQPFKESIVSFTKKMKKIAGKNVSYSGKGFDYLFPSPDSGSACKRINMFMRWVVRNDDGIDLGLWKKVSPSQLIMPVDTHVAEQSRLLGLTERTNADWKMAEELTRRFRKIDSEDPVKFDFSLCRAGMVQDKR
ncbi:MAG TPA: TIGR02757 family protein [Chitinispirillaceae bacterium]|nr:TIGR02757 family protein [Chitinispirillaceae bacterium]